MKNRFLETWRLGGLVLKEGQNQHQGTKAQRHKAVAGLLCLVLGVVGGEAAGAEMEVRLERMLKGHSSGVKSVAFSPDCMTIASGCLDGSVRLWRASDGALLRTLDGHEQSVNSVAFSPDGKILASGSDDETVKLWKTSDGILVRILEAYSGTVSSVAFNHNGSSLASGTSDNQIDVWRVSDGSLLWSQHDPFGSVYAVTFSPDGSLLASGGEGCTIQLWSALDGTPQPTLYGHPAYIFSVAFSPDGTTLASASGDASIKLWKVSDGKLIRTFRGHSASVLTLAFSPDGTILVSGSYDDAVRFWRTLDGALLRELNFHSNSVFSVAISKDGERLVTGSEDNKIGLLTLTGLTGPTNAAPKALYPAQLSAQVSFSEPSGDQALDAEESGSLVLKVSNSGKGDAYNLQVKASTGTVNLRDLSIREVKTIGKLAAGEETKVEIPLTAGLDLPTGQAKFTISIAEANGFDLDPQLSITIPTRAFQPPKLVIADVGIDDASGNSQIEPREIVDITARIQNQGQGLAKSVNVNLEVGAEVFTTKESQEAFDLGDIGAGEFKDITFTVFTNNRAAGVPIMLNVTEARGKFDVRLPLRLLFNKEERLASEFVVEANAAVLAAIPNVGTLSIDVDLNIPKAKSSNSNAVAVVIGNEDYYGDVPDVDYAGRGMAIMKRYLVEALGFQEGNIILKNNAGLAFFRDVFGTNENSRGRLASFVKPGKSDVFVFYAGHGAPDVKEKKGYFVPIDCEPNAVDRNGYPIELLYENLGKLGAKSVTVVIDACFSGGTGEGGMLIDQASPIGLRITDPTIEWPNGALFTAAASDQIASWYPEKKHSLFTYFFLKGLQGAADSNLDGSVTAGEMQEYLADPTEGVPYWARRLHNGREQTPEFRGDAGRVIR